MGRCLEWIRWGYRLELARHLRDPLLDSPEGGPGCTVLLDLKSFIFSERKRERKMIPVVLYRMIRWYL